MAADYTLADEMAYLALPDDVRAVTDRYVALRLATADAAEISDSTLSDEIESAIEAAVESAVSRMTFDIAEDVVRRVRRDALVRRTSTQGPRLAV